MKLGGSIVAPKNWNDQTIDEITLKRLCLELVTSIQKTHAHLLVVVGSGNFGHAAVKKFGIDTAEGVTKVQDIARGTGQAVVRELQNLGISAALVSPHSIWPNGNDATISDLLQKNIIPVLYGDAVYNKDGKAVIYSGEICIRELIPSLIASKWDIQPVIQAGNENGVLDKNKKVIKKISLRNWEASKSAVTGSSMTDVTGGMLHKVEESLLLASKYGLSTIIINGSVPGRLAEVLVTRTNLGTQILP